MTNCAVFLIIRRPPRSTRKESSAASDVYKRQVFDMVAGVKIFLPKGPSLKNVLGV